MGDRAPAVDRRGVDPVSRTSTPTRWRLAWTFTAGFFVAYAVAVLAGLADGEGLLARLIGDWLRNALLAAGATLGFIGARRRQRERAAYVVLASALGLWTVGQLVWTLAYSGIDAPPFPSWSDACWIACYPLYYVSLGLLARDRFHRMPAGLPLDGLIVLLTLTAATVALLLAPVQALTGGSLDQAATTLAYPVGDAVLLGILAGLVVLSGQRADRAWWFLAAGMLLNTIADWCFIFVAAAGSYDGWIDIVFGAALLCLGAAAWQAPRPVTPASLRGWRGVIAPLAAMAAATALLSYQVVADAGRAVALPALAAVVLGLLRTILTLRENLALLDSRREALTDELTGLANRRHLIRRLDAALAAGRDCTVLLADLDRFKEINDARGHHAGDELLALLGSRLRADIGRGLVARLGGDEFAVLLDGSDEAAALAAAAALHAAVERPFGIDDASVAVGASVGIALAPLHGDRAADLLRHADEAMYEAKRTGAGTRVATAGRRDPEAAALASELRGALESDALELHYQPIADLQDGSIVAVEALVRWRHPSRGLLQPAAFLPTVEAAGLRRPLTRLVLQQAAGDAARWAAAGMPLPVAVNVTVEDLTDPSFADDLERTLHRKRVPPGLLALELTESAALAGTAAVDRTLLRLHDAGVMTALDDFGTGHSSLVRLRHLTVDTIKVDRSFVAGLVTTPADEAIIRATIALAHSLGLRVVAEGIENEATWCALAALGCGYGQGFHLAQPMPAAEIPAWLAQRRMAAAADGPAVSRVAALPDP
jgi:diguanylate cyclase (GGDEF)-like protein